MNLAVIDCGTNTFNLLILEVKDSKVTHRVLSTRESVKLGQSPTNKGYIPDDALLRAINTFRTFHDLIVYHKVDKVLAFATAAFRDAINAGELKDKVKQDFGIEINVIDGLSEANLIFLGVKEAVKIGKDVALIMDIGGGSVEFIIAQNEKMLWKESFNIGAARILEAFAPSDPVKQSEIEAIDHFLETKLHNLSNAIKTFQPVELIGSSGAFESFIDLLAVKHQTEAINELQTDYQIDLNLYFQLANALKQSTIAERKQMKGLLTMRVDMIVISCLMVNFILNRFKLKKMRVSTYSLKEGAVIDFLNKNK